MNEVYLRPRRTLDWVSHSFRDPWKTVDALCAKRRELGNWPDWCFFPSALVPNIVARGARILTFEEHQLIPFVGALTAWRATQGIYSFDPSIFDALWKTPVTGGIPIEVLYHLPEWCVYIPTPDKAWKGKPLNGFFAHLDYDPITKRTDLRFLLDLTTPDGKNEAFCVPIRLDRSSIAESMEDTLRVPYSNRSIAAPMTEQDKANFRRDVPSLVSLVLYLCSESAEIRHPQLGTRSPGKPPLEHTKRGPRIFAPDRPTQWQVGYRLGAALRAAAAEYDRDDSEPTGGHASPRPHVRRAHWHTFWKGHRDQPESRVASLQWLHPILVNAKSVDDLTTTVREVSHCEIVDSSS